MSTKRDIENGSIPDKEYLYGNFQRGEDWLRKFGKKLAYKSQDLADDDVEINQVRTGLGWKELAVLAAAGLGGWALVKGEGDPPPANPPAAVAPQSPADSDYTVRFFDADGNPIDVPHISQRVTEPGN